MNYQLVEKTYKDEKYSLPYLYNSNLIIKLHYHTTKHYWHVSVYFTYPPYYQTETIDGNDYLKTRKEAREVANSLMSINPDIFWNKLSDFYKNLILNTP